MGCAYYSQALIGVELTSSPFTKKEIANCKHKPPKTAKFCPHCGVPAKGTRSVPVEGYDEDNRLLAGFDVVKCGSTDNATYFVGIGASSRILLEKKGLILAFMLVAIESYCI